MAKLDKRPVAGTDKARSEKNLLGMKDWQQTQVYRWKKNRKTLQPEKPAGTRTVSLEMLSREHQWQKDLLALIFESSPGGLAVISGPELVFTFANPAYRATLPNPALDPVGRRLDEVWPPERGIDPAARVRQVMTGRRPYRVEGYERRLADGKLHFFSYQLLPLHGQEGPAVLVVMWETTALVEAQQQAEGALRVAEQRALELDTIINAMPEPVVIYDEQGNPIQYNPAAFAAMGFLPGMITRDEFSRQPPLRDREGLPLAEEEKPVKQALVGQVVRGRSVSFVNQLGQEKIVLESASPLTVEGQTVGAISIWQDVTELEQRRRETEALVSVAAALRTAVSAGDMYPIILTQIRNLLPVDGAVVGVPDPTRTDLIFKLGVGALEPMAGDRMPVGAGIAGHVLATGQPFVTNNIHGEPRLVKAGYFQGLTFGACIPLNTHSQTVGVVWVGARQPFTPESVNLLTAVADMAANAIYRASLFEQIQLRMQRLAGLRAIDIAITSSLDLRTTLNVFLDQVTTNLGADAADVLQFDDDLQSLKLVAERGLTSLTERQRRFWDGFVRQVTFRREPVVIPDVSQKAPDFVGSLIAEEEKYLGYCAVPLVAKGRVRGVLEIFRREPLALDKEWVEFMNALATQGAIAMDNAELFQSLQRSRDELMYSYDATIRGWSRALELRDRETAGHSERVTEMTLRLARRMGVPDSEIGHYRRGVLLHDIGKMGIPDEILQKTSPLMEEEWEIMRRHPVSAYELLSSIPYLRPALDIPYNHHEKWDGTGYPRGIHAEEIPLSARIFAVVDVWDALRSDRPYRPAMSQEEVMDYIAMQREIHFDPRVVDAFLQLIREEGEGNR